MNRDDIQFSKENQTRGRKSASIEQIKKDAKRSTLGQGKGLTFSFREGEIIFFPKVEECWPTFRDFNGTEVMYITGFSELRNRFVYIPVSTFRRIPAGEGEVDQFFDEKVRPLNCELALMDTDLQRVIKLCEVGAIECEELFEAHAPVFETVGNEVRRKVDSLGNYVLRDIRLASIKQVD